MFAKLHICRIIAKVFFKNCNKPCAFSKEVNFDHLALIVAISPYFAVIPSCQRPPSVTPCGSLQAQRESHPLGFFASQWLGTRSLSK